MGSFIFNETDQIPMSDTLWTAFLGCSKVTVSSLDPDDPNGIRAACASGNRVIQFSVAGYIDLDDSSLEINDNTFLMGASAPSPGIIFYNGEVKTQYQNVWSHNIYFGHIGFYKGSYVNSGEVADKKLTTPPASRTFSQSGCNDAFAYSMYEGDCIRPKSSNVVFQNCDFAFASDETMEHHGGTKVLIDCHFLPPLNVPGEYRKFSTGGDTEDFHSKGFLAKSTSTSSRAYLKRVMFSHMAGRAPVCKYRSQMLGINIIENNVQSNFKVDAAGYAPLKWAMVGFDASRCGTGKLFDEFRLLDGSDNGTRLYVDPNGLKNGTAIGSNALFDECRNPFDSNGYETWMKATSAADAVDVPAGDSGTWVNPGTELDAYVSAQMGMRPNDRNQLAADVIAEYLANKGQTDTDRDQWVQWEQDFAYDYIPWQTASKTIASMSGNHDSYVKAGETYLSVGAGNSLVGLPWLKQDNTATPTGTSAVGTALWNELKAQHDALIGESTPEVPSGSGVTITNGLVGAFSDIDGSGVTFGYGDPGAGSTLPDNVAELHIHLHITIDPADGS